MAEEGGEEEEDEEGSVPDIPLDELLDDLEALQLAEEQQEERGGRRPQ
jgi:hypothetical protein